jgi:predicted  nucleic acid-binding Zn-ribbon protein
MHMTEIEKLERRIVLKRQVITIYQEEQKQLERKIRDTRYGIMNLRTQIQKIRDQVHKEQKGLYELEQGVG